MRSLAAGDMDGLLLLALIAERGSFSGAARELGVAPSAVSKRIGALEARLDARLLVRTTRRVALSHDGMRLHPHAVAVLEAWRAANATDDAGKRGVVRINAPGLFAETVLAPFAARYRERHPEIHCVLSSDDRMIELANGAFDVVVRISAGMTQVSALVRMLARDRLVTVASPAYLERLGLPESPGDLLHHRCLHYAPREIADEWRFAIDGRAVTIPTRPVLTAVDDATLRAASLAGLGLSVMPRMFVAADLDAGRLISVLEAEMWAPERTVHAVIVEGRLAAAHVRRFVDALARTMQR
jgi:DNA-binding transcriptional LysR family regulator